MGRQLMRLLLRPAYLPKLKASDGAPCTLRGGGMACATRGGASRFLQSAYRGCAIGSMFERGGCPGAVNNRERARPRQGQLRSERPGSQARLLCGTEPAVGNALGEAGGASVSTRGCGTSGAQACRSSCEGAGGTSLGVVTGSGRMQLRPQRSLLRCESTAKVVPQRTMTQHHISTSRMWCAATAPH